VVTDTATEGTSQCLGGSGILPASDTTRDTDSVSMAAVAVDMEVVVEVMAEAVAVAEEDTVEWAVEMEVDMVDRLEVVVEAADTDLPDLLTCSSHLLLILLHLTQKP